MELKKSKKANLERQRVLFFQIGLLLTLGIVLAAFEWGTRERSLKEDIFKDGWDDGIIEEIPITRTEQKLPPPPPVAYDFKPVNDDFDIDIPDIQFQEPDKWKNTIGPIIFGIGEGNLPPVDTVVERFEVDIQATFMGGGTDKFQKWVSEHTIYPRLAEENGIEGKVSVKFIIDKQGYLSQINVQRSEDPSFEDEVIRVLRSSPKWEPAIKKGRPVSVAYYIPVNFSFRK